MNLFKIESLLRDNIKDLKPYSSARDEFSSGAAGTVFLDANENSLGSVGGGSFNRYPDPRQTKLRAKFAKLRGVKAENVFLGNGSDEAVDLLYRCFCRPGIDRVLTCPPTYGMYAVSAAINDIEVIEIPLDDNFEPQVEAILKSDNPSTKILFLCSPNNPTGSSLNRDDLTLLLDGFSGLVVVDEAYVDFSLKNSSVDLVSKYPSLVVLQTFSKAWGLAGLRLGAAIASSEVIEILDRVKPPYNVNSQTQELVLELIEDYSAVEVMVDELSTLKEELSRALAELSVVSKVFQSDANFLLVRVDDADVLYDELLKENIVVRNRSREPGCENCLRLTVGTASENKKLIETLGRLS